MMKPDDLLVVENGHPVVRIGGYVLPAEDFSMSDFMKNDLGMSWLHPGGITSTERLLSMVEIKPEMRVLDLGCGLGSTSRLIAKRFGCEVAGIDRDREMIAEAKARSSGNVFKRLRFDSMDGTKTNFADNSFDVVVIQSVACFNDKAGLFREVNRLLKAGGSIAINESTWVKTPTESVQRVTRSTVCQTFKTALIAEGWEAALQQAGFRDIQSKTYEFTAMSPYQMLREEGFLGTLRIMWTVLRNPRLSMRLSAVSDYFTKFPGFFGYGLYSARKA